MQDILIIAEPHELNTYGENLTGSTTLWCRIISIRKDPTGNPGWGCIHNTTVHDRGGDCLFAPLQGQMLFTGKVTPYRITWP